MLKKAGFLVYMLICMTTAYSQIDYSYGVNNWQYIHYHSDQSKISSNVVDSFALENRLYQITKNYRFTSKKKESFSKTVITIDRSGRSFSRFDYYDTGYRSKITSIAQRSFNQEGLMAQNTLNSNWKKRNYSQFYQFNDSGKVIETIYYNHKYNYSGKSTVLYNVEGKRSTQIQWNKRNKVLYSYKYYYFANGQLKQTVLAGKKGQPKRVTDYTCDETGKTVKKMKDTFKICTVKSYLPDGSIVKTTQSFTYNGLPQKEIEIRNANDQIVSYELFQGVKENLKYSYLYTYSNNRIVATSFKNYYDKHHPTYRITEFDLNGRITKDETVKTVKRNKPEKRRNEFKYNDKGMIVSERRYEGTKLKCEIIFSYTFY